MKLTPKEIAEDKSKPHYSIPIYQRLFEWDSGNVGILLDDLWQAYFERAENYYIGMLTTTSENELVDGQQRFVVMMLLGCVLREYYPNWGKFIFINDTSDDTSDKLKPQLRLKFPSRPDDEAHLKHLALNLPDETAETKMGEAVWRIYNFLEDKTDAQKMGFSEYVFNRMSFFISKLPEGYDAVDLNKYFERMNTQGKNLEPHEILKVKLLRHFGDDSPFYMQLWNRLSDVDRLFIDENKKGFYKREKQILLDVLENGINSKNLKKEIGEKEGDSNRLIKNIKPSSEKPKSAPLYGSGSRSPLSFPQLLLQTLYYLKGSDIKGPSEEFFETKNLNKTFDEYLPSEGSLVNKDDILDFLKTLVIGRLALDFCFIRLTDSGYSLDMDLSTEGSEDEERRKLHMFESMLFVSESPLTNRKTKYNWFSWLMEFVEDPEHKNFTARELLDHFKREDNEKHGNSVPSEENLSYGNVNRYWFWRLDYYLWERREEFFKDYPDALSVAEDYIFRYNRSIEHVAPQSPKQESSLQWGENEEEIRDSFGNLVMISSGLNSSLSNAPFEEKRARVESYCNGSSLGSIESLKLLWIFTKYETWNKDNIQAHQEEMLKILKDSFKHPSNS